MKFEKILNLEECKSFIDYFNSQSFYKDNQVKDADILHNWPMAMELCVNLKDQIEEKVGINLIPHQGWIRKYSKGNVLKKHVDGRADFALSILLGKSSDIPEPLLIYYEDTPQEVDLLPGDGYFFEGSKVFHERKALKCEFLYGIYLGYRRANVYII